MIVALTEQPLDSLTIGLDGYLSTREGRIGVAIVVPGRGAIYVDNGDAPFALASVAKAPIMMTLVDQANREGRALTEDEQALLSDMITESDNDAASVLWDEVGAGEGVASFLASLGIGDFGVDPAEDWGESTASARTMASLLAMLLQPGTLDETQYPLMLDLLSHVDPEQQWGITAGLADESGAGLFVGLKNGWYPEDDGWRVNSAGVIIPAGGSGGYALAILTDGQPDMEYGVETIEHIAALVNAALLAR
jgi:beta-lactamase class A